MSKYFFTAKSQKGESYSDTLEAKDKHELARILRQEGYVLISATEAREKEPFFESWQQLIPFLGGNVSLKERMFFTRNLQVMVSAGVPLPKCLTTLSEQSDNKKFKKVLLETVNTIVKGESFSGAIAKHPDVFPTIFVNMIKVGEESGTLEGNLGVLARQMERENDLKTKIKGAMMYPAVIIAAMIGIGVLMLVMVVPQLAQTFDELGVELPMTTQFVVALGTFLATKWYLAIIIIVFLAILLRVVLKTKKGKAVVDSFVLKIPVISTLVKKINATHTIRTLSSLIVAGTPLVRSLQIISETLDNSYFKEAITEAVDKVKKGIKLSEALRPYQDLYSLTIIQMLEMGEETGETSDILQKLADFYETEIGDATKNLSSIVEPIIMLIIGGAVGFFAISMIQPMYAMLGSI